MLERVFRKLKERLPESSVTSIPLQVALQTGVASLVVLTLRWSSVLVTAMVTAATVAAVPTESLVVLAPLLWADRTALSYLRVRRT
ncbi:hypothetical protein ACQPZG_31520 [Streptomyces sp. CA-294286]|uniref:hypothetical protein n=1 Tax=Streptomyces sp. CA-294286 TaxID=3240070 RepID=UPI003D9276A4